MLILDALQELHRNVQKRLEDLRSQQAHTAGLVEGLRAEVEHAETCLLEEQSLHAQTQVVQRLLPLSLPMPA